MIPARRSDDLPGGTIAHLLRGTGERNASRPALIYEDIRYTFGELAARAIRVSTALRRGGIGRGATIAAMLDNGPPMVELLMAAAELGATVLALNWRLAPDELDYILTDAAPALLVTEPGFAKLAGALEYRVPHVCIDNARALPECLEATAAVAAPAYGSPQPEDRWYLIYTSGTTGRPKGCQHSQAGYFATTLGLCATYGVQARDICLLSQPLFHVGGLSTFLAWHIAGAAVVIPRRHISAGDTLDLVYREAVSVLPIPILERERFFALQQELRLPLAVRLLTGGGGRNDPAFLLRIAKLLGADMSLGYGQSEVGGVALAIDLADQLKRPSACGKPVAHLRARIVDDAGHDVAEEIVGELLFSGPGLTTGYLNLSLATADLLIDGWLHTGDLFRRDAEGFLHFVARKKELVKTAGENVYPEEVEAVIRRHAAVLDCCVVGVPDARFGEAVKAFVVLRSGPAPAPADLAEWCRTRIASYKRPRFVEFVTAIARDAQGKPQRTYLSGLAVTPEQIAD